MLKIRLFYYITKKRPFQNCNVSVQYELSLLHCREGVCEANVLHLMEVSDLVDLGVIKINKSL